MTPSFEHVQILNSGEDTDWSTSLLKILDKISERYIFLTLDDVFLITKPDAIGFSRAFSRLISGEIAHIHMRPMPSPDVISDDLGLYEKGAPYAVNVLGFWNKKHLRDLLIPGEDPWMFEIMGSYRASLKSEKFGCLTSPLFKYFHAVDKGKWVFNIKQWNRKLELELALDRRKIAAPWNTIVFHTKHFLFNISIRLPWRYRLRIMNFLRKILCSY